MKLGKSCGLLFAFVLAEALFCLPQANAQQHGAQGQ